MDKDELIKRWLNGDLSESELRDFEKTEVFKEIEKIDRYLYRFKAPDYDVEQGKERLLKSRKQKEDSSSISFPALPTLLKIAASLIIISGITFYYLVTNESVKPVTLTDIAEYHLPDNSYVRLNAESNISYSANNWDDNRLVHLDGEAYFKVNEGSRFSVMTNRGVVSVLGTEFNVKVREDHFEVVCYEGKVLLEHNTLYEVLKKGEMIQIIDNSVSTSLTNDLAPSWVNGKSSFKSVPLKSVLKEFERQYEVDIQSRNIPNEKLFTGTFVNDNIDLAIKSITIPMNLSYEIREGLVILSGGSDQ